MKKYILLFLVLFALALDYFAQGCSQCKLLAEQGSELDEQSFGSNINSGILYLMIIPYILLFLLFRKRIVSFLKKFFVGEK
jgi:hypothetical protein